MPPASSPLKVSLKCTSNARSTCATKVSPSKSLSPPPIATASHDAHRKRYGYDHSGLAVEAVTARIRAVAPLDKIDLDAPTQAETFSSVYIPPGWASFGDSAGNLILTKP